MKRQIIGFSTLLTIAFLAAPAFAQNDQAPEGAAAGSSAGSAGIDDNDDKPFTNAVRKAALKGHHSSEYIDSLVELGMHYNRQGHAVDATKVLSQALSIIDSGAMKPAPANRRPDSITVEQKGEVTSGRVNRTPTPYEDTLSNLLPALVEAEISAGQLKQAETHVKRLIHTPAHDQVSGKVNLMSAYRRYAEILRKQHRTAQANEYDKKADDINHSFKGL
jgi:hypothetical protein